MTNKVPLNETSGVTGTVRDALSRLASLFVPQELHAQTYGIYDPYACIVDELGIMGAVVQEEIGVIDVIGVIVNSSMLAVDCGEVVYGEGDPNVYTLPTIYVWAEPCHSVTMYLDVWDSEGQLMGEDSYEVSSCDLNEE